MPWPVILTGCRLASPGQDETPHRFLQDAEQSPRDIAVGPGEEVSEVRQLLIPITTRGEASLGQFVAEWKRTNGLDKFSTEYSLPTVSLRPPGLVVTKRVMPYVSCVYRQPYYLKQILRQSPPLLWMVGPSKASWPTLACHVISLTLDRSAFHSIFLLLVPTCDPGPPSTLLTYVFLQGRVCWSGDADERQRTEQHQSCARG